MTRPMLTPRRALTTLALSALALLPAACASGSGGGAAGDPEPFAELVIDNDNPRIVTVFAVRSGTRSRLGTVNGVSSERFELRRHMLEADGRLQVMIEPLGSSNRYFSDPIYVSPGDVIELSVSGLVR